MTPSGIVFTLSGMKNRGTLLGTIKLRENELPSISVPFAIAIFRVFSCLAAPNVIFVSYNRENADISSFSQGIETKLVSLESPCNFLAFRAVKS